MKALAKSIGVAFLSVVGWLPFPVHGQIAVKNQGYVPFSEEPINYRSENLTDPVALFQKRIDRGEVKLDYEPKHGYLKSILEKLAIPVNSQTLVFSKTSFQYKKISPEEPRALYFNDDVYIGQVHDGKVIEVVSFDPAQGAIFYILDEHQSDHPIFQRAELDCTQCHVAAGTKGVPGVLLRSLYTTRTGTQATPSQSFITGQESPLKERWGGWYVTGTYGSQTHMGNVVVEDKDNPEQIDRVAGANVTDLSKKFDPSLVLSDKSDVVAHPVLAHQTQAHNLITLTNYQTRIALYKAGLAADVKTDSIPEATRQQYQKPAEQLVRYLLFADEAPLEGQVKGDSGYTEEFAARGPRDPQGRSLRDFDLRTRIFKYPCSYLIYNEAFDSLPAQAREYVYHRLFEVLTGRDQSPAFARLNGDTRRAILEILLATKPGLPAEWTDYKKELNPPAPAFYPRKTDRKEYRMKRYSTRIAGLAAVAVGFATAGFAADAHALEGRWDATLTTKTGAIPFRLDISGEGATLKGTLYNGWDPFETTTGAKFENGTLILNIDHYLTKITASLKDGQLDGKVVSQSRADAATYGFHATRYAAPVADANAPSVAGSWEIPLDKPNAKGEKSQRLIVLQKGAEVSASILRVDGDTGALNGTYKDGKWVLSHWDGSRPAVMELSLAKDGTLEVKQEGGRAGNKLIAYRTEVARAKGLAEPEDYTTHTTMRDPDEVFAYKFPDVNGKTLSNDDPKFKNKVVLAIVTGTWCPNCHDEAQYLVQLYAKYHDKGLEIVALDFEEPEQQDDLARVHAFIKQYKIPYTYLIAGAPAEMWEKVPQAVNLNTWPATLFVGRDGKVKHIHTGFASPASGVFNAELKQEFTATIEQLLKEKVEVSSASLQ